MAAIIFIAVALCVVVHGAPPAPPRFYQQGSQQQLNPLDYYLDNPEVANFYNQPQQKQANVNGPANGAPARLESLEPDSEVELIPGAQQPQQPPQQNPVSPNLPGLVPGQRVFIVHMPVPGYRPGSIGGYQPVYIVAAAPQGNPGGYAANGYQNAILVDPSGQGVLSPVNGYYRPGVGPQPGNPLLFGGPGLAGLNRPYDLVYQDPGLAYQQQGAPQPVEGLRGSVRLAQFANLQGQSGQPAANPAVSGNEAASNTEPKRVGQSSESSELKSEEPRRNARPTPAHAQTRNKA